MRANKNWSDFQPIKYEFSWGDFVPLLRGSKLLWGSPAPRGRYCAPCLPLVIASPIPWGGRYHRKVMRSNPDKIIQKTIRQVTQQKGWIATLRSQ